MRWANLGYHYDWDNRCYFKDSKSEIPLQMKEISKKTINLLNIQNYDPESVIVNYYSNKDTMGGHLDDGEPDQENPILSFSLGLSCIFLIGGKTKDIVPIAVRLDSGDLAVMSSFSRNCFHGVPRVFKDSFNFGKDVLGEVEEKGDQVNSFENAFNFLKEFRINFNYRQVVKNEN